MNCCKTNCSRSCDCHHKCCDCCECNRKCDCKANYNCGCGSKVNCGCGNGCQKTCCLLQAISSLVCRCGKNKKKNKSHKGSMVFAHGHHEVKINTVYEPNEVFVSLNATNNQVCMADVDVAGVKVMPDGFILYADIKSAECKVKWIAK